MLSNISFTAASYDYRYTLLVDYDLGAAVSYVTTLANEKSLNTAAYGAPTFGTDTNGLFQITNGSFPATGVTCYYDAVSVGQSPDYARFNLA